MNKDLTVGKPISVLIKFSLPLLGSMIFQQLYNIADSFVAGKLIGSDALAAVGNSYEITLIFIAFAIGSNMGTSVLVSHYFGAKDMRNVKCAISTAFLSAIVLSILLMVFGIVFCDPLLRLISTPEHLIDDSALYLDIYTMSVLFMVIYNISNGIFSAMGDSKTPFIFLAISSTSNIILDILFVSCFGLGIMGVGLATLICQGASAIAASIVLYKRVKSITTGIEAPLFSYPVFRRLVALSVPSILQQSFVSVGNIFIQSVINSFGAVVMAGYAAAIKINSLGVACLSVMGNGVSSFTAQNIGAGRIDRVKEGRRAGMKVALGIAFTMFLLYTFLGHKILLLIVSSADKDVLAVGVQFLRIVSPFYLVVLVKIVTDATLRGCGLMKTFMFSTLTDLFLRAGLSYLFSLLLGPVGIWMSWPVGWSMGTLVSLFFFKRVDWAKYK